MGFGEAAINLQTMYQNFLDLPWYFSEKNQKFQLNPKFSGHKYFWKVPIWYSANTGVLCGFLYSLCHLRTLLLRSYAGKQADILEVIAFLYALGITTQASITSLTVQRRAYSIIYAIQETFSLAGVQNVGWPNSERLPDLQELIAYCIASGSYILPVGISVFSILFDFDPINIELKVILSDLVRKLIASLSYLVLVFYATNICISFILLLVATCHMSEKIALECLFISKCVPPKLNSS